MLSSIFSINPILSALKVFNWAFIMFLVLPERCVFDSNKFISKIFDCIFIDISCYITLCIYIVSKSGLGFQGMVNHPQAMAVLLVILLEISLTMKNFSSSREKYNHSAYYNFCCFVESERD